MTPCPACAAPIPDTARSAALNAARCPACAALIDFAGIPRAVSSVRAPARRPAAAAPERWSVDDTGSALTVRWKWMRASMLFLVPFTLLWNGVLLAFAAQAAATNPWHLLYGFVFPHAWVGVGLTYYLFALFLNHTEVQAEGGRLRVHHGPLWWPGRRTFEPGEVAQLFALERRSGKGHLSYELCALLAGGKRVKLLGGLGDAGEARFLEQRLEAALGITDVPVEGELGR
jgi:hypothetical protein